MADVKRCLHMHAHQHDELLIIVAWHEEGRQDDDQRRHHSLQRPEWLPHATLMLQRQWQV